jgi:imidazolonepropionase
MLIRSISQLLTLQGGLQRGHELGQLGILEEGAVLVHDQIFHAIDSCKVLWAAYPGKAHLDACGCAILPGSLILTSILSVPWNDRLSFR